MTSGVQQVAEWERVRSTLSHDVLKNEVIPAVSKLENILVGRVIDDDFIESFQQNIYPAIVSLCADLRLLAESAEDKMSPTVYFASAPLNNLDEETKRWLPALVHALWLDRSQVATCRIKMCLSADSVCQAMADISNIWDMAPHRRTANVKTLLIRLREMAAVVAELEQIIPYRS